MVLTVSCKKAVEVPIAPDSTELTGEWGVTAQSVKHFKGKKLIESKYTSFPLDSGETYDGLRKVIFTEDSAKYFYSDSSMKRFTFQQYNGRIILDHADTIPYRLVTKTLSFDAVKRFSFNDTSYTDSLTYSLIKK